jgi:steroid 5-alpha reductase family enzyme
MDHINFYICYLGFALIYMFFWFLVSRVARRNDVADVAWGLGFVSLAFVTLFTQGPVTYRKLLCVTVVTLWGFRLAVYVFLRNRKKPEDERYRKLREKWGKSEFIKSLVIVFGMQGLLLFLVSLPVLFYIASSKTEIGFFEILGGLISITGLIIEALADYQKNLFKKEPHNRARFTQVGLWKYSRHPNYFGEILVWWGAFIMAISEFSAWWTIIGPVTITFLLLKVTGIPMLEKNYKARVGYAEYLKSTRLLLPWPKKQLEVL